MMSTIEISALGPRWKAIDTWRPSSARQARLRAHIVAADHVEHHRDPLAFGPALDRVDEVGGLIIDRMGRAELDRRGAFVVATRR